MEINELLLFIQHTAERNKINKPFIVGGVPRDRVMGKKGKPINDVDITTGGEDSNRLSELVARTLTTAKHRTYDDGHSSIDFRGLRVDFSNNFQAPHIDEELGKIGEKATDINRELFSRDFCLNTLLEEMDFSTVYDLTGKGIDDIKAGLIRCPIDPEITISADPRRILRAIRFAVKFGFKIEESLRTAILNNRKKIQQLDKNFIMSKMNEIVRMDDEKGLNMLIDYKLLPLVPLSKEISDLLIQKRQLVRAL